MRLPLYLMIALCGLQVGIALYTGRMHIFPAVTGWALLALSQIVILQALKHNREMEQWLRELRK